MFSVLPQALDRIRNWCPESLPPIAFSCRSPLLPGDAPVRLQIIIPGNGRIEADRTLALGEERPGRQSAPLKLWHLGSIAGRIVPFIARLGQISLLICSSYAAQTPGKAYTPTPPVPPGGIVGFAFVLLFGERRHSQIRKKTPFLIGFPEAANRETAMDSAITAACCT
jgi:hypothetical protein